MKIGFLVIGFFILIIYVPFILGSWWHHRKYPILSDSVPHSILQRGDYVDLGNGKTCVFEGREQINLDLLFRTEETMYNFTLSQSQFKCLAKSIKNKYGYKWIKQTET